jgi:hypothetical protein
LNPLGEVLSQFGVAHPDFWSINGVDSVFNSGNDKAIGV